MKLLMLLMSLLMAAPPVQAEELPVIPVEIIQFDTQDASDNAALTALTEPMMDNYLQRWEKVLLSDGREGWVLTVFDLDSMGSADTRIMIHDTKEFLPADSTETGYFDEIQARWEQALSQPFALWTLREKALFHQLYVAEPRYGQPILGELSQGDALTLALAALKIDDVDAYQVGYGYLTGEEGVSNGVWEIYLVRDGETVHKVNLDAASGAVLYIEPDEEGNG